MELTQMWKRSDYLLLLWCQMQAHRSYWKLTTGAKEQLTFSPKKSQHIPVASICEKEMTDTQLRVWQQLQAPYLLLFEKDLRFLSDT